MQMKINEINTSIIEEITVRIGEKCLRKLRKVSENEHKKLVLYREKWKNTEKKMRRFISS